MSKRSLKILLVGPRGFCAGVDRAIKIVEVALEKHGPPIYVRHEIVHNKYVVEELEKKGAIFVEELREVPEGYPVVFSAHGVPRSVIAEAKERELYYLDATCPLVTKVHVDVARHRKDRKSLILIGHANHPEVIGTMGQLSAGEMILVENIEQAENISIPDPNNIAFVTQTTLSVSDTAEIIKVLKRRFPKIEAPRKEDICYATTNRQAAVTAFAGDVDATIAIGAPNSSNSNRLAEVAIAAGCPKSIRIQNIDELEEGWLDGVNSLLLTAGASAPEILVKQLLHSFQETFDITIENRDVTKENVHFSLPQKLKR